MERWFSAGTLAEFARGDAVGGHTETHRALGGLATAVQRQEIENQALQLEQLGLPRPRLFRPPYGSFDATTLAELRRRGMVMVLWSIDSEDYLRPGVDAIVRNVVGHAAPGAIVLLHDGGGDRSQTAAALPAIIRQLRARGYTLVTVPRLLRDDAPPASRSR
jgi:peptidoglycan/xylan/chitin deacetylase (PgdA/CDA1 family)